jgi:hypothetical protein
MKFGSTGEYPLGKLDETDEGALSIGIATDKQGNVIINFGKPVAWIGMPKDLALQLASLIKTHAETR